MCTLCDAGTPQDHSAPRRQFLKASAATGFSVGGLSLLTPRPASADNDNDNDKDKDKEPKDSGERGRRYLIRGGAVMSMDPKVGDFAQPTCWSKARRSSRSGRTCTPAVPRSSMRAGAS
jgi:hypothetical protein